MTIGSGIHRQDVGLVGTLHRHHTRNTTQPETRLSIQTTTLRQQNVTLTAKPRSCTTTGSPVTKATHPVRNPHYLPFQTLACLRVLTTRQTGRPVRHIRNHHHSKRALHHEIRATAGIKHQRVHLDRPAEQTRQVRISVAFQAALQSSANRMYYLTITTIA